MTTKFTGAQKEEGKGKGKGCKTRTAIKEATPTTARRRCGQGINQQFSLMAPEAAEVYLVGDFNDWQHDKDKMRKLKSGLHKKDMMLKPGRYEYRFIVDGHWWTDPTNEQRCRNAYGEDNSVLEI
ncbi:MAG: glycoside hydrolase family 13 [Desulfobulbaceae bacterium]|nr:MAG: glycoside hydrolase family 13 [Desulfobulbaceae bacterium]